MHKRVCNLLIVSIAMTLLAGATFAQDEPPQGDETLRPAPTAPPAEGAADGDEAPAEGEPAPQGTDDQQPGGLFGGKYTLPLMIGGFILLYMMMGRGRRKKESERKKMLSVLKKGDKITTIGGIIGTVIEVKEHEVTVKVDETNNVRMKFVRRSINTVGGPEQEKI